ncbi:MAG: hypothetical protein OES09_14590 [Gammaproteobacteria bacterium]|nr:hypothetical protein [Gammaproteobacteria bacterium]
MFDGRLWVILALAVLSPSAWGYSYAHLVQLIESRGLQRIEDVLPHLPTELRRNYTLAYRSRSAQEGSFEFPRAILFGRDAKFIIAFNGHPEQRGFTDLEVLQFNDQRREFELYRISFADKVVYSAKNPKTCVACHGASPRPIWSSYEYASPDTRHWPGMYGSIHDAPRFDAAETAAFKRFQNLARHHPRYRVLALEHPQSDWFPYGQGAHQHRFRPNNRLGNLLGRLNAQRVAARILARDSLRRHPNTAWLWLLQCPEVNESDVLQHVRVLLAERSRSTSLPAARVALEPAAGRPTLTMMFEELLAGPETDTWNLTVAGDPPGPSFSTGIIDIDQLVAAVLLGETVSAHQWLGEFYRRSGSRELYDGFESGYYTANVQPGGVGADYDALGAYYDTALAQDACPRLFVGARTEMETR